MNSKPKAFFYATVLIAMAIGKIVPAFFVLVGSAIAIYITATRRLDLLPVLILTNVPITSFLGGDTVDYGSYEYSVEVYQTAYINFLGLPISAGFVTTVSIGVMCIINFFKDPFRAYPGKLRIMFFLWVIGAFFALFISLNGMLMGNNAWSTPLRGFLSLSGVFYGYFLISHFPGASRMLFRDFSLVFLCFGILGCLGIFHHRVMWIGAAIIPVLAVFALKRNDFLARCIGVGNLLVWVLYCILGYTKSGETTFTLQSLFIFSLIFSVVFTLRSPALRQTAAFLLGTPAILIVFFYMSFSIYGAHRYGTADLIKGGYELSLAERIKFKMFDDRARHWSFVIEDITRDNKILPIPGELMRIIHPTRGEMFVTYGAHNSYLEALRQNGVVSGGIIILTILFSIISASKVLKHSRAGVTTALAIGAITTLLVGGTTGHYVIGQTAGVYIFILAGMSIGRNVDWMDRMNKITKPGFKQFT